MPIWITTRIDKDSKDARNKRIFDVWMACYTQEEIAEREDLTQKAVDLILEEMASMPKLLKSDKALADHATDFDQPIHHPSRGKIVQPGRTWRAREGVPVVTTSPRAIQHKV